MVGARVRVRAGCKGKSNGNIGGKGKGGRKVEGRVRVWGEGFLDTTLVVGGT